MKRMRGEKNREKCENRERTDRKGQRQREKIISFNCAGGMVRISIKVVSSGGFRTQIC